MTRLYFLRHAHAIDHSIKADHDRELTDEGIQAAKLAAKIFAALEKSPVTIFSSPRVRAFQTAEFVAKEIGVKVNVVEEVNYGFDSAAVTKLMQRAAGTLMFVGHEPYMSETIGAITGGSVEMKRAGLARVDLVSHDPLRGMLVWLLAPKVYEVLNG